MENLVSPELIASVIGGVLVTGIVGWLKAKFPSYSPKVMVLVIALVLGGLYQAFITYMPTWLQEEIVNFFVGAATMAVFLYEFVWKTWTNYQEKKKKEQEKPEDTPQPNPNPEQ